MLVLALLGCPAVSLPSDGGTVIVTTEGLTADPTGGLSPDSPFLAGTSFAATLDCPGGCPDVDLTPCYTWSFNGPAQADGGVVTVTGPGAVVWHLTPAACDVTAFTPVEDALSIEVVAADATTARLQQWPEEMAIAQAVAVESTDGTTAESLLLAEGEPIRVLAGSTVTLPIRIEVPDQAAAVAFAPGDLTFSMETTAGPTATVEFAEGDDARNYAVIGVGEGTEAVLHAAIGGHDWALGSFVGVPESEVNRLAVVAAYVAPSAPGGDRAPMGARAVARDADGNAIFGVPIDWSAPEDLLVMPGADRLPGPDYVEIQDVCIPPSQRIGARIEHLDAAFGDLTAGLDLTWNGGTDDNDEGFAPDLRCDGAGCGCSTPGNPLGAFALAAVLPALRRRRMR